MSATMETAVMPVRQKIRCGAGEGAVALSDEHLDELIVAVMVALIASGWRLLPPGMCLPPVYEVATPLSPATLAELSRAARNRGCDRL